MKFHVQEHLTHAECEQYYEAEEVANTNSNDAQRQMAIKIVERLFNIAWERFQSTPSNRMGLLNLPEQHSTNYYDTHDKWQE